MDTKSGADGPPKKRLLAEVGVKDTGPLRGARAPSPAQSRRLLHSLSWQVLGHAGWQPLKQLHALWQTPAPQPWATHLGGENGTLPDVQVDVVQRSCHLQHLPAAVHRRALQRQKGAVRGVLRNEKVATALP